MPNYKDFFKQVGLSLERKNDIDCGVFFMNQKIMSNPKMGTSAYNAGFQKGDKILKIGSVTLETDTHINSVPSIFSVGEEVPVVYERFGAQNERTLTIGTEASYDLKLMDENSKELNKTIKQNRDSWLNTNV